MGFGNRASVLLLLAAAACGHADAIPKPGPGTPTATTRDSAGIAIIDYGSLDSIALPIWRIGDSTLLKIGAEDRGDPYILDQITGAKRLDNGSIVVSMRSGDGVVRLFDANGNFVRQVGRKGGGPGEYSWAAMMYRFRGDSIAIYDGNRHSLLYYDSDGRFARQTRIVRSKSAESSGDLDAFDLKGAFADGMVLAATSIPERRSPPPGTIVVDSITLYKLASGEAPRVRFGRFWDSEHTMRELPESAWQGGPSTPADRTVPVGPPRALVAAGPTEMYYARGNTFEINTFNDSGQLTRIIRGAVTPVPRPNTPMLARRMRARLGTEPTVTLDLSSTLPPFLPPIAGLVTDRVGNLWVRSDGPPAGPRGDHSWLIFDPTGSLIAMANLPRLQRISEIGRDYVLGIQTNSDGVESVVMKRLSR
jgi:hypothetical protein